jgi:hypothetical protein
VRADQEPGAPISEPPRAHAPQSVIHSWRDFLVQIAVVTIGLLLALGLQQIVETVHHRSERAHLEEQMHETFVANQHVIAENVRKLDRLQAYLVDLRASVGARIEGRSALPGPVQSDPRNFVYVPPPSLGAYEASKANGTVALLSFDTIRLYDRIGITIAIVQVDLQRYLTAVTALRAFAERFDSAKIGQFRLPQVNLAELSAEELLEYRALIGNMIGAAGEFKTRMRIVGLSSRAILDGVQTEADLRTAVAKLQGDPSSVPAATGGGPQ